ncbi:diaminopropionate ammonia-lyase [bacterium]|nr:diaminopropionate ammonia-lyase [bacterium]
MPDSPSFFACPAPSASEIGRAAKSVDVTMPKDACLKAQTVIRNWPGYAPSPLRRLEKLEQQTQVAGVYYQDESRRFGLKSFKGLGGAYAVLVCVQRYLQKKLGGPEASLSDLLAGKFRDELLDYTVCTATDGNHGRSVAWGAKLFGCRSVIYIHEHVSIGRQEAMEALGATVIRVKGNYDDSVRQAKTDAGRHGWQVISDTSWPGYADVPALVLQGYTLMVEEALGNMPKPPTHVFIQGGVGALAASVAGWLWHRYGKDMAKVVLCEPTRAACLKASFEAGKITAVHGALDTMMAGLACGEVSEQAWAMLNGLTSACMALPDSAAIDAMRGLAAAEYSAQPIIGGESAVAGLAGFYIAAANNGWRQALGLDDTSEVLLFGTEGDTDPELYQHIVGKSAEHILAGAA